MSQPNTFTQELEALGKVLSALEPLTSDQMKFVLKTAADRLGFNIPMKATGQPQGADGALIGSMAEEARPNDENLSITNMTPKAFIKAKQPDSDVLRATCLAYYLTHARNQVHFKTEDIVALNTEAAYQNFGNALKTVNNAMARSRFLAPAGSGKKQITTHGEDVVNALPDQATVKTLVASYSKKNRAKLKSKKARAK